MINNLTTWCKELTDWKRLWWWERLKSGGEGDDRRWVSWMASLTQWTWVWTSSGIWWWTGKPGVLQSMRSQRVRHDWVTELNWEPPPEESSQGLREERASESPVQEQREGLLLLCSSFCLSRVHSIKHVASLRRSVVKSHKMILLWWTVLVFVEGA